MVYLVSRHVDLKTCFSQIQTMEAPYGDCIHDNAMAMSTCKLLCKAEFIIEACGCVEPYMENVIKMCKITLNCATDEYIYIRCDILLKTTGSIGKYA